MKYLILYSETEVISINEYYPAIAVLTNDNYIVSSLDLALIALQSLGLDCTLIEEMVSEN